MTTLDSSINLAQFISHENQCFEDEDESLSLCDLPISNHQIETYSKIQDNDPGPGDFEFGSGQHGTASRQPEHMCTPEEVFFQGQILPLRHSISRKINRSASVSVDPKTKIRNQFHSHPSPSPKIRTQSFRTCSRSNAKTSSLWSFMQVGLVKPQEIGLSDLKNRSKRSGSYNSNSSSNSSSMNSSKEQNMKHRRKNTMKKQRLLLGGCNCSADSVERTMKEPVQKKKKKKTTKEENMLHVRSGEGRIATSRHRTFEWLKQLSIAAPTEA